jgi:hypothetical protein
MSAKRYATTPISWRNDLGVHLDALAAPSRRGAKRIAGVDLQKPRMQAVAAGVIALAASPHGFTANQLAAQTKRHRPRLRRKYGVRQAAYDLRKLRTKGLVQRVGKTRTLSRA